MMVTRRPALKESVSCDKNLARVMAPAGSGLAAVSALPKGAIPKSGAVTISTAGPARATRLTCCPKATPRARASALSTSCVRAGYCAYNSSTSFMPKYIVTICLSTKAPAAKARSICAFTSEAFAPTRA